MNRIRIHIDRIVVDGPASGAEQALREAIARELGARFAAGSLPADLGSRHVPVISIEQTQGPGAAPWSTSVAQAITGALGNPAPATPDPAQR